MSETLPKPRYSIWEGISAALTLAMRAIEEVRAMKSFGLENLDLEYDGERKFTFRCSLGKHGDIERSFTVPVLLDRGVYRPDHNYAKGDTVTAGGSLFIAQSDNPEGAPGLSKDWRLAVKRGRDGKDGKNGEKGEKGDPGRHGKDGVGY